MCTVPQIDFKVSSELQKHGRSNKTEIRGFDSSLSAKISDKINQVSATKHKNPKLSARKHALSVRSLWRILHFDLQFLWAIEEISPETLCKLHASFQNCIQACVTSKGGHMPEIVFKTWKSKYFVLNCSPVENKDSNSIGLIFINLYNPGICYRSPCRKFQRQGGNHGSINCHEGRTWTVIHWHCDPSDIVNTCIFFSIFLLIAIKRCCKKIPIGCEPNEFLFSSKIVSKWYI